MSMHIYLSGAMTGLTLEEQNGWRKELSGMLREEIDGAVSYEHVVIFNPCLAYNTEWNVHKSEREIFEYDINNLKRSSLVIANLNRQDSIGTCMELAIAKDNGIPVVGLNERHDKLHPWIDECCIRVCDNILELVRYVVDYFVW